MVGSSISHVIQMLTREAIATRQAVYQWFSFLLAFSPDHRIHYLHPASHSLLDHTKINIEELSHFAFESLVW